VAIAVILPIPDLNNENYWNTSTQGLNAIAFLKEACQQEGKYSVFTHIRIEPYLPS
jgi:hypothetical protein